MTTDEIKKYIANKIREGESLSKIQDELKADGCAMTFMELRLIASGIGNDFWKEQEKPDPAPGKQEKSASESVPAAKQEPGLPEEPAADEPVPAAVSPEEGKADAKLRGKTSVTLSPIQRPGYVASGTVTFGSGASGDWCVDEMGRFGFEKLDGKPDTQDIREFQMELHKAFQ